MTASSMLKTACAALLMFLGSAVAAPGSTIVSVNSNDMTYDPATGLLYVGVPSSSSTNPSTLIPVNPNTGAMGAPIGVLTNPTRVVSSSDGTDIYVLTNSTQTVQQYNPITNTFSSFLPIEAGDNVSQIYAVPGQSNMVAVSQYNQNISPGEAQTAIFQNGVRLPNYLGSGPDITAVNYAGTRLYGYVNKLSSYNFSINVITPGPSGGLSSSTDPSLQGLLNGNVGTIAVDSNKLYDNQGNIYSVTTPGLIGEFQTDGTFALDPANNRFYSVNGSGSNQTLYVYGSNFTNSMILYGTIPITGAVGSVDEIVRFGADGLALRTPTQVILLNSALVPEPSTAVLATLGMLGLGYWVRQAAESAEEGELIFGSTNQPIAGSDIGLAD